MRSAVSSILSEMSEPSALAFPDYQQSCADHRRLLVLVRAVSPASALRPKTFARVLEVLDRGARVQINSAEDVTRQVEVRFLRGYPAENNEWGEFQHHRAVLGLISVGSYRTRREQEELGRLHDTLKVKYSKHLLCSRLVALQDLTNNGEEEHNNLDGDEDASVENSPGEANNRRQPSSSTSCATSPHCHLEYRQGSELDEKTLEGDVSIFLSTMFWLLEKARVEKKAVDGGGGGNGARIPLLCAPFERRDFVGLDMESRVNRRRTSGRFKKHLGDLSLMCGLPREAYDYYEQAADVLRSCNDWLWLANALEGVCAVAASVHYPRLLRDVGMRRNSSIQQLNTGGGVSMAVSQLRRIATAGGNAGGGGGEREDKQKSPSRGSGAEYDESFVKRVASRPEVAEYIKDVVVHYSKYRNAGLVETEASVKAVQILMEENNVLMAAEFLQNIVFINLQMNDEEKVHRFSALSRLYGKLGMRRKAAFFHRVAAMRCVAPQNPQTDWASCYGLLLKALPGYNVDFQRSPSPRARESGRLSSRSVPPSGWPVLQIQIMQELVGTSRRMGDHAAATRHMAFIVQALFSSLRGRDRAEMCQQLALLTAKSPGTPVPHAVEAGLILPPVNIYTVPLVTAFSPCSLPEPLVAPSPSGGNLTASSGGGPFIFTPIQHSSNSASGSKKVTEWVQGEVASVELTVANPLPVELRVEELTLMHEGAAFDAFPTSLAIQPDTGPQKVKLTGIPQEKGELKILGYSCVAFGVRSNCRAKCLRLAGTQAPEDGFVVKVCPSVPRLELSVLGTEEKAPEEVLDMDVYHGEEVPIELELLNSSSLAVESLETSFKGAPIRFRKSLTVSEASRQDIQPGDSVVVRLKALGPSTTCRYSASADGVLGTVPEEDGDAGKEESAKTESFSARVVTKFSGSQEVSQGYSRQVTQQVRVTLRPSLSVTWWDVLPGENSEECYLVLDVRNASSRAECELEYGEGKRIAIDAGGKCRIPLPVKKVGSGLAEEGSPKAEKEPPLAEYLDRHVDLRWRLQDPSSGHPRTGRVSLAGLELDEGMRERLHFSPVSWSVAVNGERWSGRDISARAGEPLWVEVAIDNHYRAPVRCRFKVEAGYAGGEDSSSSSSSLQTLSGSGSRIRRGCRPGQAVRHRCGLLATAPGQVRVSCFCDVFREEEGGADKKLDSLVIPDFFVGLV